MILIADSGSTKCDWCLIDPDKNTREFTTAGINPLFHNQAEIEQMVRSNQGLLADADKVRAVFFYAAGSSTTTLKKIVEQALAMVFPMAEIYVDHDLVAAALATYEDDPCISCILGTGSNSCHFDGDIVRQETPSLGFILGDEGSGSYFGKQLLADHFYKRLPREISEKLDEKFALTKDSILDKVYRQPNPNVYLASFMPFVTAEKEHPYFREMIYNGLSTFMKIHVACYRDFREIKTHFIGSVASLHEESLRSAAADNEVTIGQILQKPLDGLVRYHVKHHLSKVRW